MVSNSGNAGIPELRTFLIWSLILECANAGMWECGNTGTTYHVLRTKVSNTVSNSGMWECGNAVLRTKVHQVFNLIDN